MNVLLSFERPLNEPSRTAETSRNSRGRVTEMIAYWKRRSRKARARMTEGFIDSVVVLVFIRRWGWTSWRQRTSSPYRSAIVRLAKRPPRVLVIP